MAKPILDDTLIEEILKAMSMNKDADLPSSKLITALAKASGKMEGSIRQRYIELYRSANDTDDDPFIPHPGQMG